MGAGRTALLTRDLERLTATAAAELGRVVTLNPGGELAEAVDTGAEAAPTYGPAPTARDIVERLVRLHTAGTADLVLDTTAEDAYQRLSDRFSVNSRVSASVRRGARQVVSAPGAAPRLDSSRVSKSVLA